MTTFRIPDVIFLLLSAVPPDRIETNADSNGIKEANAGESVTLTCKAYDAKPVASIKWFRNGSPISPGVSLLASLPFETMARQENLYLPCLLRAEMSDELFIRTGPRGAERARFFRLTRPRYPRKRAGAGNAILVCRIWRLAPSVSTDFPQRRQQKIMSQSETVTESAGSGETLKTTESSITLKPTSDDNEANYSCQAVHEALGSRTMSAGITLDVFYPPGRPHILGMDDRPWVRAGELVTLECRSVGGNPPAELIWFKEGQKVDSSYHLRQVSREKLDFDSTRTHSVNWFKFNATKDDDKKEFQCRASSRKISKTSLSDSVKLVVYYEPEKLQISGKSEARINETVQLSCDSSPSNPSTKLKWVVDGQQVDGTSFVKTPDASGGVNSSSTVSITVGPRDRNLPVACYGTNEMIAFSAVTMINILVIRPPTGPPEISGYEEDTYLTAGTELVLNCVVMGGYPSPVLKWYFNDAEITGDRVKIEKSSEYVTSNLKIDLKEKDNGAVYKCQVTQDALPSPTWVSRTLQVKFPPREVRPRVEPTDLSAGTEATLTCRSTNSNPPATLIWLRNSVPVIGGTAVYHQSRLPGHGVESELTMKVNLTHDDDGAEFTCEALSFLKLVFQVLP
ncbi:unnamed protein product [Notodromas monacha]|uniref:Ig-like domain-containing protein n=1 Tax=Notodromas monacha TaxID=399045 RepID=A0A7R9GDA0_9CRUS|nr:unnamed protein product [Notodromas monacha]CAG0918458.1 unnamed protein product [Notodromas monacha]